MDVYLVERYQAESRESRESRESMVIYENALRCISSIGENTTMTSNDKVIAIQRICMTTLRLKET